MKQRWGLALQVKLLTRISFEAPGCMPVLLTIKTAKKSEYARKNIEHTFINLPFFKN